MKTKNNTILTFLDKMQFSAVLCLATYDWFCADGSHLDEESNRMEYDLYPFSMDWLILKSWGLHSCVLTPLEQLGDISVTELIII